MTTPLYLGLDIGTTACKAVAIDASGKVYATGSTDYPTHSPKPGASEQDVFEIWQGVQGALKQLAAAVDTSKLRAMGLSGAMHTFLPVAKDGRSLSHALTWADTRRASNWQGLRDCLTELKAYERTGCPAQWPYHPARAALWHERYEPNLGVGFIAIKDWILLQLTGALMTDTCIASSTGWLNLHSRQWDDELLAISGVHRSQVPMLIDPLEQVGVIDVAVAGATGLPQGMPVFPGGSDGGMANLGCGATEPGDVVITVGTSGAVRITTDKPLLDPLQRTWCYSLTQGLWFAGGAINNGGLAVNRIRGNYYAEFKSEKEGFAQLFADAERVEPGAQGVLLLPFFTGERTPYWRPDLKAELLNDPGDDRRLVARAVLEAVAFCLGDVWDVLQPLVAADVHRVVHLTGGITQSPLWSQIVCDVLGLPMLVSEAADASAVGAALIAMAGTQGEARVKRLTMEYVRRIEPDAKRHEHYKLVREAFKKAVAARL